MLDSGKSRKFVDEIEIIVEGGKGGPGCISFHREKYRPKGGPDGGDGGEGGDVYLLSRENLMSLEHLTKKRHYKAQDGKPGEGNHRKGKKGEDLYIYVPVGTQVWEEDRLLKDFHHEGEAYLVAKGGKGGKGNAFFKSSIQQAPRKAQKGLPGEKKKIRLVLKCIADIGLIGLPNAGKSTLLKALTSSDPLIAPYPFSTLTPNLGVMEIFPFQKIILADIPGIIADAHKGVGLGISFLKHIERVKMLLYVLDIHSLSPEEDYKILQKELKAYSPSLLKKPYLILLNKCDEIPDITFLKELLKNFQEKGLYAIPISAKEKKGIKTLKAKIKKYLQEKVF